MLLLLACRRVGESMTPAVREKSEKQPVYLFLGWFISASVYISLASRWLPPAWAGMLAMNTLNHLKLVQLGLIGTI